MRTTKPTRGPRPGWSRTAGYGGAVLLVVAAVVVLLMPLFGDEDGSAQAGRRTTGAVQPTGRPVPGGQQGLQPTNPTAQQNQGGQPYPTQTTRPSNGGQGQAQGGNQGSLPGESNGGGEVGFSWCPQGTAAYRPTADSKGLEVLVNVSGSGAVKVQVVLPNGSKTQQAAVKGGRAHTFRFQGVPPLQVQRVKVTTLSTGLSSETCYAPQGA